MSSSEQQIATDLVNLNWFSNRIRLLTHLIYKLQVTFQQGRQQREIYPHSVRAEYHWNLHDVEFNFGALGFNVELEEGGMF